MSKAEFSTWFRGATRDPEAPEGREPHPWQVDLAMDRVCCDRLIRVPTGLGKTAGTVLAWLWNRVHLEEAMWPRRLVFCLPMRVLVEQTVAEARRWIASVDHRIDVHAMMGGSDAGDWHLEPERPAVLVGTQDMLLSRALNRGYGCPRARWPAEFGLLHQDALWVMDEVQLMDVGLATSAQLQAFRETHAARSLRPCHTWWMSATLQRRWMNTADTCALVGRLPELAIPGEERTGSVWEARKRCLPVEKVGTPVEIARRIFEMHREAESGDHGRITLAIFNTVDLAVAVHEGLEKLAPEAELRLIHSRFRGRERRRWRAEFLDRRHCSRDSNRIIVSTQVVEAGVDVSATSLVTELAPWPSLVQRFGRAARYGGAARILVVDRELDEKGALPYSLEELEAARDALARLDGVSQAQLEDFEAGLTEDERAALYPFEPLHLLTLRELEDLFDTTPDLTGADLDVSRFIRSGDERDLHVFWRDVPSGERCPSEDVQPEREELCPIGFLQARDWLCRPKSERLKDGLRAWVWSYLDGAWRLAARREMIPGRTLLVDLASGGYDDDHHASDPRPRGFTGDRRDVPLAVAALEPMLVQAADAAEEREDLSTLGSWKTLATHGREVGSNARRFAATLGIPHGDLLDLAGRWHDLGKAHPAFQACIRSDAVGRPTRDDLAKAPKDAWVGAKHLYRIGPSDRRRGFRHELASALALFDVLGSFDPEHPALIGPHRDLLASIGVALPAPSERPAPSPIEAEILALSAEEFDLLAYLVASHHGKVRMTLHASPADQQYPARDGRGLPIRGVREGDRLPETVLCDRAGDLRAIDERSLTLSPAQLGISAATGASWSERTLGLLRRHGPFALAYLEAVLRAADVGSSRLTTPDPLLEGAR